MCLCACHCISFAPCFSKMVRKYGCFTITSKLGRRDILLISYNLWPTGYGIRKTIGMPSGSVALDFLKPLKFVIESSISTAITIQLRFGNGHGQGLVPRKSNQSEGGEKWSLAIVAVNRQLKLLAIRRCATRSFV